MVNTCMDKKITYKHITAYLCCLMLFICFGCIHDELPECEDEETCVYFNFIYDYHMQEVDLFAEQVDHITLIIYTEKGEQEHIQEIYREDMEENHTVSVMLPSGTYTAVAWGNIHTDHYQLHNPEKAATQQLEMTCIENQMMTRANPGSLFHAFRTFQVITGNEKVPMSMVKNSNQIKVVIKGLTEEDLREAEERFTLRLTSYNWKYNFDNTISSEFPITYLPERNEEEDTSEDPENISIAFTFYPLQLSNKDMETELSLNYRDPQTDRSAVLKKTLVPLLLNRNRDGITPIIADDKEYLEREDTFEVVFVLGVDVDGNIRIVEWEEVDQGGDL
ncbi:MAG: FimB/Mfa2 family fimbrial subunit [Tannerellaceae bacterium]|nr:FimB/Mfa2 family fimbrial subunit [Tannerellaceae bacterium]